MLLGSYSCSPDNTLRGRASAGEQQQEGSPTSFNSPTSLAAGGRDPQQHNNNNDEVSGLVRRLLDEQKAAMDGLKLEFAKREIQYQTNIAELLSALETAEGSSGGGGEPQHRSTGAHAVAEMRTHPSIGSRASSTSVARQQHEMLTAMAKTNFEAVEGYYRTQVENHWLQAANLFAGSQVAHLTAIVVQQQEMLSSCSPPLQSSPSPAGRIGTTGSSSQLQAAPLPSSSGRGARELPSNAFSSTVNESVLGGTGTIGGSGLLAATLGTQSHRVLRKSPRNKKGSTGGGGVDRHAVLLFIECSALELGEQLQAVSRRPPSAQASLVSHCLSALDSCSELFCASAQTLPNYPEEMEGLLHEWNALVATPLLEHLGGGTGAGTWRLMMSSTGSLSPKTGGGTGSPPSLSSASPNTNTNLSGTMDPISSTVEEESLRRCCERLESVAESTAVLLSRSPRFIRKAAAVRAEVASHHHHGSSSALSSPQPPLGNIADDTAHLQHQSSSAEKNPPPQIAVESPEDSPNHPKNAMRNLGGCAPLSQTQLLSTTSENDFGPGLRSVRQDNATPDHRQLASSTTGSCRTVAEQLLATGALTHEHRGLSAVFAVSEIFDDGEGGGDGDSSDGEVTYVDDDLSFRGTQLLRVAQLFSRGNEAVRDFRYEGQRTTATTSTTTTSSGGMASSSFLNPLSNETYCDSFYRTGPGGSTSHYSKPQQHQ